jgi:hypothetical protein
MQTQQETSVRELAGSFLSFGWAMSLFAANQLVNLMNPKKVETSFSALTQVTRDQVGEAFRPALQVGENLQRGAVDFMSRIILMGASAPARWVKSSTDGARQAAPAARQFVSPNAPSSQIPGWGPVD